MQETKFCLAVAVLVFSCALQRLVVAQEQKPEMNSAAWLAGCWEGQSRGKQLSEQWMKPKGDAMFGAGRTVANDKVVDYEFMQIRKQADGQIYFVARPANQPEASFKLMKFGPNQMTFENPEHDFPQTIIYRLQSDGSLLARIEGKSDGKQLGIDFHLKRAKCD